MVDGLAAELGEGEGGEVGDEDLVLGIAVGHDVVGEVALELGREGVPCP